MFRRTRKLIALIGLAVVVGAPLTPARALVPTAGARGHAASGLGIMTRVDWDKDLRNRRARDDSKYNCAGFTDRPSCEKGVPVGQYGHMLIVCKWQKGTVFHKGEGYCYPAK
jgi:hypothetical protein